jgi:hypothetical protein
VIVAGEFDKRQKCQFFTAASPFDHPAFRCWAEDAEISRTRVLEPFAGDNSLIRMLRAAGLVVRHASFDIDPQRRGIIKRNVLQDFPLGFQVCVTNPPWMARNMATKLGFDFPQTCHNDLYKLSLELCLSSCRWVAAIVPETYIAACASGLFTDRALAIVSLPQRLFRDTGRPACLALFGPEGRSASGWGDHRAAVQIWSGPVPVGDLLSLHLLSVRPEKA